LWSYFNFGAVFSEGFLPWIVLLSIVGVGFVLDPVYIYLQGFRWDHDWPFAFQLATMIFEFLVVIAVTNFGLHPLLPSRTFAQSSTLTLAASHFSWILVPAFLALLGPIQIFLVRWRFKGGELGRFN
jgi:hypothetical protein